ncbi:hypothetical protein JCM9279_000107 [Rhodotorula babjevae]
MQAYEQHVPLTAHSLKRRSRSPSPQPRKRRPPPSYAPSIYADLPPAGPPRSLSTEAIAGSPAPAAPPSGRSTPADWLQRTRDLHLQTPTCRTPAVQDDAMQSDDIGIDLRSGGAALEDLDHAMLQDDEPPSPQSFYAPQPAVPLPSRSHASASPFWAPLPPASAAPHDAPPLHQHLAGSPQPYLASSSGDGAGGMARSASGGSVRSMGSAAACGAEADLLAHAHAHGSAPASSPRKASTPMPGTLGGRGGGWKVTMGYRADCERCLRQEQGHSTHVVWSS